MTDRDRQRLRALARQQLEIAQSPEMRGIVEDWAALGRFEPRRPMIQLELGTFEQELLPQRMQCEDERARALERTLLRNLVPHTVYGDDKIVRDYLGLGWHSWFHPFGHAITRETARDAEGREVGHRFNYVLEDLEADWALLGPSQFGVDREGTEAWLAFCTEAIGDILPVRMESSALYAVPTQDVVHLMGMEAMLFAMMDYPERFLEMMDRLADDYLAYFDFLVAEGLVTPTTGAQGLGQGTYCFTDELPDASALQGRTPQVHELWGYLDSQESVGVSPQMYAELIFPCYRRIAEAYGLLSYGCCEPVHAIWDDCLSTLDNLRRVSISPWCDEAQMGEALRGRRVVYHRKPSPNYLSLPGPIDEPALAAHIDATLEAARGCTLEFTQRDVYTLGGDESKARRYIEILRERIARNWRG